MKVILIDNDVSLLKAIARNIRSAGIEVITFFDESQMLDSLNSSNDIDVIISDMHLDHMNGKQLYDAVVASHPKLKDKFIFISGDPNDPEIKQFIDEHEFLCKPFKMEMLIEKISKSKK